MFTQAAEIFLPFGTFAWAGMNWRLAVDYNKVRAREARGGWRGDFYELGSVHTLVWIIRFSANKARFCFLVSSYLLYTHTYVTLLYSKCLKWTPFDEVPGTSLHRMMACSDRCPLFTQREFAQKLSVKNGLRYTWTNLIDKKQFFPPSFQAVLDNDFVLEWCSRSCTWRVHKWRSYFVHISDL